MATARTPGKITLQTRHSARLSEIEDSLERDLKRLYRLVNRITALRQERKRILKPRKLAPETPTLKITGEEYTKIREQDFGDEIPDFLRRV